MNEYKWNSFKIKEYKKSQYYVTDFFSCINFAGKVQYGIFTFASLEDAATALCRYINTQMHPDAFKPRQVKGGFKWVVATSYEPPAKTLYFKHDKTSSKWISDAKKFLSATEALDFWLDADFDTNLPAWYLEENGEGHYYITDKAGNYIEGSPNGWGVVTEKDSSTYYYLCEALVLLEYINKTIPRPTPKLTSFLGWEVVELPNGDIKVGSEVFTKRHINGVISRLLNLQKTTNATFVTIRGHSVPIQDTLEAALKLNFI